MSSASAVNQNNTPNTRSSSSNNGRGVRRWGLGRRVVATLTLLSIINPLLPQRHSSIQGQESAGAGSSLGHRLGSSFGVAAVPVIIVERQDPAPAPTIPEAEPAPPTPVPESPTEIEVDPCMVLGELREPYIGWGHIKRCYEHVPFNATESNTVVSTMHTLLKDYYIFLDTVATPDLPKPFTSKPIDILQALDQISRTDYASDFRFQTDMDLLMQRLNDAHANYLAYCYRHYLFEQPIHLYAPVVDKVQTVRIMIDNSDNLLEDCQVQTIDGVNALDAIQAWIDINYGYSKDAGVRLNKAISAQTFNSAANKWTVNQGLFTSRVTLPEQEFLTYEVSCPDSPLHPGGKNYTLQAPWDIYRLISWKEFDSTESYLSQNCYRDTDPALQHKEDDAAAVDDKESRQLRQESLYQAAIETPRHLTKEPRPAIEKRHSEKLEKRQFQEVPIAHLVSSGTSTAFYQLVKRPNIGVVVIPTHSVSLRKEARVLEDGFSKLYESGVRNVILDLTGNGGGYVNFAYDLVDWMFPDVNETSVYVSDLRTSMSVKALAQKDLEWEDYNSYFNPSSYSDAVTGEEYETNFFMQDKLFRRVNQQLDYSPKVRMNHNLGAFERGMSWQHDASRIVVMTDGTCGSACGMSLNRLKNRHGVKSYAIGGRHGEDLSLFSFPGASVYSLSEILEDFKALEVDPPMQLPRYKGIYRVPVMQFFDDDETRPIEFRPEMYKADFHLDYTPLTARRHELLWEIVANNHWAPEGQTGADPSIE
ncbi:MAG: hypothetical protein J3R72DRAFT_24875 [Linnemannia gamsii]|nr:MAG: hypothetical protein J3R72DRAFT_24875 [Linnemannia gamsii]